MPSETEPKPPAADAATIDGEHAVQIGMIDALLDAVAGGAADGQIEQILARFRDYTRLHFLSEELLMRLHGYPAEEGHIREHGRMVEELEAVVLKRRGRPASETLETIRALRERLMGHIRTHDAALTRFLAEV